MLAWGGARVAGEMEGAGEFSCCGACLSSLPKGCFLRHTLGSLLWFIGLHQEGPMVQWELMGVQHLWTAKVGCWTAGARGQWPPTPMQQTSVSAS